MGQHTCVSNMSERETANHERFRKAKENELVGSAMR